MEALEGSPVTVSWVRTVEGDMLSSKNWASPWLWRGLERVDSSVVELTRPEAWSVRVVMAVSKFIAGVGIGLVVGQSMVVVGCCGAVFVLRWAFVLSAPAHKRPKAPSRSSLSLSRSSEQRNQAKHGQRPEARAE